MKKVIMANSVIYEASVGGRIVFDAKSGINQAMLPTNDALTSAMYEADSRAWEFYNDNNDVVAIVSDKDLLYISEVEN